MSTGLSIFISSIKRLNPAPVKASLLCPSGLGEMISLTVPCLAALPKNDSSDGLTLAFFLNCSLRYKPKIPLVALSSLLIDL